MERMMRKKQVAPYCELVEGVQDSEKRGVRVEVKKVICMRIVGVSLVDVEDIESCDIL